MKVFLTKYRKLTPNSFRPTKTPNVMRIGLHRYVITESIRDLNVSLNLR